MKIKEIIRSLEATLPLYLQEEWDNCGLQVGDPEAELRQILLAVDPTEEVIQQAIATGANLVVTHHPLLFKGIKRIGQQSTLERSIALALQHGIVIYSAHTNADKAPRGLNFQWAKELGLTNIRTLELGPSSLSELTTFVPEGHLEAVRQALWQAGAGRIGAYDCCSYSTLGEGTFRPMDGSNPFIGKQGALSQTSEYRLQTVFPTSITRAVLQALHEAHPYEVPAVSITQLSNPHPEIGLGVIGELAEATTLTQFLQRIKQELRSDKVAYAGLNAPEEISRVALCGGAGAFLLGKARSAGAQILITGEAKYNDYLDAEGITLATAGHYETEFISTRLFEEIIRADHPDAIISIAQKLKHKINTI